MNDKLRDATSPRIYVCRASGEGVDDYRVCSNEVEVRAFYAEEFCGADDEAHREEVDSAMASFADADNWARDCFHEDLYCATWTVWRVPADIFAVSETAIPDRNAIIEECAALCDAIKTRSENAYEGPGMEHNHPQVKGEFEASRVLGNQIRALKATPSATRSNVDTGNVRVRANVDTPSAIGKPVKIPPECHAPGQIIVTMTLGNGEWYCHGCGASDREPECKSKPREYVHSTSTKEKS